MTHTTADVRQELLDAVAQTIDEIAKAVAALGGAYELLDEVNGDRLEAELFRPIQLAYGRAQRTYSGFAERYGLTTRAFVPAAEGAPSHGVQGFIDLAVEAVHEADGNLVTLQDSMMPVEFGDEELRAGLSEVRRLLGDLRGRAAAFSRGFGR